MSCVGCVCILYKTKAAPGALSPHRSGWHRARVAQPGSHTCPQTPVQHLAVAKLPAVSSLWDVPSPELCLSIVWGSTSRRGPKRCQGERQVLNGYGAGFDPVPWPSCVPQHRQLGCLSHE